jgi:integrase
MFCGNLQIKKRSKKKEGSRNLNLPTIRQLPSGSWSAQIRINGKSTTITDKDYDTVYAKVMAFKTGIVEKKEKPENMTVREACLKHINTLRPTRSPTTIAGYEKICKTRFQHLMDMKLVNVNPKAINDAIAEECKLITRTGKQISPKTVNDAYMFIAPILKANHVDVGDPALPELKRKLVKIPSAEEVIPVIVGTEIELPCLLACWLSLSISEIRGLTKSKSVLNGKLYIVETVVDVNGKPVRKEDGKEEQRTRVLDIPPYIQTLIDKVDGDVICPLSNNAIYKRFTRLLKANGVPHMSFHQLRHLNASVMAMLDIPTKDAQERGGWKTPYTMQRVYTHTFTAQRKLADVKVNDYFNDLIANAYANEN